MYSFDVETSKLIKELQKKPLLSNRIEKNAVEYVAADIDHLIPHRPPMRLIDGIIAVDLTTQRLLATRTLTADDPIFAGHFPGQPIYPGVLQIEMMGQAALCLAPLLATGTLTPPLNTTPMAVRALRIFYAQYFEPLKPGDSLEIHAAIIEYNGMTAIAAGQIIKQDRIAAIALQEVYFVE